MSYCDTWGTCVPLTKRIIVTWVCCDMEFLFECLTWYLMSECSQQDIHASKRKHVAIHSLLLIEWMTCHQLNHMWKITLTFHNVVFLRGGNPWKNSSLYDTICYNVNILEESILMNKETGAPNSNNWCSTHVQWLQRWDWSPLCQPDWSTVWDFSQIAIHPTGLDVLEKTRTRVSLCA